MASNRKPEVLTSERLKSLDLFRGLVMFLLIGEAAQVYHAFTDAADSDSFLGLLMLQFHHHPWNGLRFWDLIQPAFMFIVGVAMPFSLASRLKKGSTWIQAFRHILRRCLTLLALGVGLHCVYNGRLVWELWNVLSQLSFTILVTFLLLRKSYQMQLAVSVILLVVAEVSYRLYDPSAPFVKDENFGSYMDMVLMGKINNGGGWVTINCMSTAAHTIWGAMCGKLLLSDQTPIEKVKWMTISGLVILVSGYSMDLLQLTPIVKRIATTSFVLVSGGYCLLMLAFLYWIIDVRKSKATWFDFLIIVGMNPIFIYLFAETVGHQWFNDAVRIFNDGFLGWFLSDPVLAITNALLVWYLMWYICYWLFRKRIFFKI